MTSSLKEPILTGKFKLFASKPKMIKCPTCRGTGEITETCLNDIYFSTCTTCGGDGEVENDECWAHSDINDNS